jgi:hypothetical protein
MHLSTIFIHINPSIDLPIYHYLSVCLSVYLYIYLPTYQSINQPIILSINLSTYPQR